MFVCEVDMAHPRYDGTASAHVSTLGGRYDYSFDCHDRLVGAAYTAGSDAPDGEDFSAEYAYSETGAPLSVRRRGVISAGAAEEFGEMDRLSYSWDGALLESVSCEALGEDFYGRTGHRLSAAGGDAAFGWNSAGLLVSDSSRGIRSARHNWLGQPLEVEFADGSRVAYAYTCGGELLSVGRIPAGGGAAERTYCGAFVFEGDSLAMVNFGGGYFDGHGNPHYRHSDWQGSVTMVTDESHSLVQHTGYYPYGEPWREPSGQPYLYGAKERQRDGGLNEYDYSARRLNSALALWTAPDPLALSYCHVSPYAYCASNPIKYTDPTGNWNVEVNASSDRGKHPYALFSAYSDDGNLVFRTIVKVQGVHRERAMGKGDTPTGNYKIIKWIKPKEAILSEESFGPNHVLLLNYESGEGYPKRSSIMVHGGRSQEGNLTSTWGCIRMADEDISTFREITSGLKRDDGSNEQPESLTVADDLQSPVDYSQKEAIMFSQQFLALMNELISIIVHKIL